MILLLVFVWIAQGQSCHPECHWQCDDPVCAAVCEPICQPPVCEYQCMGNGTCPGHTPACSVNCPSDQCEVDMCPQCETICAPPPIACSICSPLCEQTNCTWRCRKPAPGSCQYPRCELQCELPACVYSAAAPAFSGNAVVWLLLSAIVVILL